MIVGMTNDFYSLFRKADISGIKFNKAIKEILDGNVIPLGKKIFKKRVGSRFGGKRGGYRTILYYRIEEVIIFMYLYAKNEQEDISDREKKAFVELSGIYDKMDEKKLLWAISENKLVRWNHEDEK
jgi:hypothetical protein